VFDPQSFFAFPVNWVVLFIIPILFPLKVWCPDSRYTIAFKRLVIVLKGELSAISKPFTTGGNLLPGFSLFTIILLANFAGLLPYVFPGSGHLVFAFSFALPLWLGHVAYRWLMQPQIILAHLVPTGSPNLLMPFIVLIELVRSIIRPLTLSVRLVANIVAGHLLLTLLSLACTPEANVLILVTVLLALVGLSCLETAVATIQAYVFRVLSVLYIREVDSRLISVGGV